MNGSIGDADVASNFGFTDFPGKGFVYEFQKGIVAFSTIIPKGENDAGNLEGMALFDLLHKVFESFKSFDTVEFRRGADDALIGSDKG